MMDRKKKDELPKMQVGFIDAICMPVYKVSHVQQVLNHWVFETAGYSSFSSGSARLCQTENYQQTFI